jgi:hypothetical protein
MAKNPKNSPAAEASTGELEFIPIHWGALPQVGGSVGKPPADPQVVIRANGQLALNTKAGAAMAGVSLALIFRAPGNVLQIKGYAALPDLTKAGFVAAGITEDSFVPVKLGKDAKAPYLPGARLLKSLGWDYASLGTRMAVPAEINVDKRTVTFTLPETPVGIPARPHTAKPKPTETPKATPPAAATPAGDADEDI